MDNTGQWMVANKINNFLLEQEKRRRALCETINLSSRRYRWAKQRIAEKMHIFYCSNCQEWEAIREETYNDAEQSLCCEYCGLFCKEYTELNLHEIINENL